MNKFTVNYDMAFDYALDNLGIHYINGFAGIHNRYFKPEVYDYDLYYPGESISGKVHRAEKVLKYYKLHGSLSWQSTESTFSNPYGIEEISLNQSYTYNNKQLIVYPCTSKKSFTLDLPYSELFRQFANAIRRPQSVLFCLGYSFNDEHINDIIKQALSIPSFTLFIVNYSEDNNRAIQEFKQLKHDKRIIVLDPSSKEQSTFISFVKSVMPELYEIEEPAKIAKTMQAMYPNKNNKS